MGMITRNLTPECDECAPGLITRGFTKKTIITRGLSKCVTPILKKIILGGTKKLLRIIVSARLKSINDEEIEQIIKGVDSVTFYEEDRFLAPRVIAKWIGNVVKNTIDRIVIKANRIFGLDKTNGNN